MKKPVLLTLLFALISMSFSFAQTRVTGTVTSSDDGTGVPFATIVVKGNNNLITTTDANGNYVFPNIPGNAVLVISSIGFTTLEISVNNRSVVNALLSPDATALEEVMVVAYGSVRRRDLTSAVATVRGDELIKAPVASMDQAMQGKMAGVQITASSGSPGAAVVVRVRGAASLLASNDPLYVVDGVPMPGSRDDTYLGYGGASTNAIAGINPADIESIQVLKDASAAALYGSRASNGVILITTKSGKAQKTKVNFDAYYGVQNLRQRIEMLGATEWIAAQNEARDNYNSSLGFLPGNSRYVQPISPSVPGVDVDWLGEVTRSAPLMSSIQVSTSGGNEGTQFYLSAGRFQQQGLVYNDDFLRYSFRSRIDHRFNSKVRLSLNANYSFSDNNRIYNDNNIYGVLLNAFRQRPDQPVYDPNNPENYFNTTRTNAVACYKEVEPHNRNQRLIGNFRFEWELIKNLTFNSTLAADITNIHEYQKLTKKAPQAGGGDEATDVSNYQYNWLVDNTLSYRNSFGPVSMTALVGQSFNQVQLLRAWVRGFGFVTDDLKWIESAAQITNGSSSYRGYAITAYFGRLSFNVSDKYLIEGSLRTDGSSRFPKDKRWGIFPAGAVGWRISNESFFPKNNVLTDVKLRGSLGLTGNQDGIEYFRYMTLYTSTAVRYDDIAGIRPSTVAPNPDLTWEKTLQTDIGLDLAFLNNRMEFTYDYFIQDTRDLLQNRPMAGTTGWSTITSNVGSVKNWGHEFSFFSRNVMKKNFQWNTSLNITFLKSKVTDLARGADGTPIEFNTGIRSRIMLGQPISTYHAIKAIGIYQSDSEVPQSLYALGIRAGDVKYEDHNEDGLITADDRQPSHSGMPSMYGGLNNTLSFHGFDLVFNLQWSYGNYVYTYWKEVDSAANAGRSLNSIMKKHYDKRWTPENPHNDPNYPRFVFGSTGAGAHNTISYSDRWLQDASYLRLKALTLGYTLPAQITRKFNVDNLRCYISADNLWTFTKYDGYDPEVQYAATTSVEQGMDFATAPLLRTFSFGINISF